jgi:hypothetical protein
VKLLAGKILITGIASHPTELVEHPEARRISVVIVSVKRDREDPRARTRYTNTNSSEAIERNEAYGSFSVAC